MGTLTFLSYVMKFELAMPLFLLLVAALPGITQTDHIKPKEEVCFYSLMCNSNVQA